MTWAEVLFRFWALFRVTWRDYRVQHPVSVLLGALAPRVLTQVVFWTLLGRAAGSPEQAGYAFTGALAQGVVFTLVARACDIPLEDAVQGLNVPLRVGRCGPVAVLTVRWLVYVPEALVTALVALLVAAPLVGQGDQVGPLLARLPHLLLLIASTACFGVGVAALAGFSARVQVGVLAANLATYLTLVLAGGITVLPDVTGLQAVAVALPVTHGIAGLRGEPGAAAAELSTALGWLAIGALAIRLRARRMARVGIDDRF